MKHALLIFVITTILSANSLAQERIYRCGNEYTNTVPAGQKNNCKLLESGNVSVVQAVRPAPPVRVAAATQAGQRVDGPEQRSRDVDARQILESELKRSQSRRDELLKEYNNGEPEKQGPETRNHQKYLDRVAELKANLDRNDSDIAGLQREIGRISSANNPAAK